MPPSYERNLQTWTIRVVNAAIQSHTHWLQSKDICYLSAHTKLADYNSAVTLSSETLAQAYCAAISEVMRRRHGDNVKLIVEPGGRKKTPDDQVVAMRIAQRNFAPNKSVFS